MRLSLQAAGEKWDGPVGLPLDRSSPGGPETPRPPMAYLSRTNPFEIRDRAGHDTTRVPDRR
mgnify:CR=1 FL=1